MLKASQVSLERDTQMDILLEIFKYRPLSEPLIFEVIHFFLYYSTYFCPYHIYILSCVYFICDPRYFGTHAFKMFCLNQCTACTVKMGTVHYIKYINKYTIVIYISLHLYVIHIISVYVCRDKVFVRMFSNKNILYYIIVIDAVWYYGVNTLYQGSPINTF